MDKKILLNIVVFTVCFILWVKYGVEVFWLVLAIGFVLIILFIICSMIIQNMSLNFYENKYRPFVKRVTGMDLAGEPIRDGISPNKLSRCVKGDKTWHDLVNFLGLGSDEEIFLLKRLHLFNRTLNNSKRSLRDYLVITSTNLIIFYSRKIERRDIIPLSDIVSVEGKMKYSFLNKPIRPILIIRSTQNGVYEVPLSTFKRNIPVISEITEAIKRFNPQLNTSVSGLVGNDPIYSEQDKRLLLLLPFLMFLLGLALWRLFQYISAHGFDEVKY